MADLTPESIWKKNKKDLLELVNSGFFVRKPKKVSFFAPGFKKYRTRHFCSSNSFPIFSITGDYCALNCKHCGSRLLGSMVATTTTQSLLETARELKERGGVGCLVSGGCLPDGSLPLKNFIPALAQIKRELGLTVLVHTGILDSDIARDLKEAGIDAALIDIIGSDKTISKICNLDVTTATYEQSLSALSKAGLNFIPHVIAGLENGRLDGELQALRMISRHAPSAIVIIAFMPIRGTDMAYVKPPQPIDTAKVVAVARSLFPNTPIALGCMRPKGTNRDRADLLALKAGVDAIAFPSEKVVEFAENNGYQFTFSLSCCSQIYLSLPHKTERYS